MTLFLNPRDRWESAELNQAEAADCWGDGADVPEWTRRYEEEGERGLVDPRFGRASGLRVPADRAEAPAERLDHAQSSHGVGRTEPPVRPKFHAAL
jgi:hypothetical protein